MNQTKEFLQYIFNAVKIWIIVQPWEEGLRVRLGKNIKYLKPGIYFRIPYFDSVFLQETRLRVADLPVQACTTKDGKSITLKSALGYSIENVEKLYKTLYHPESSIINIAMGVIADEIFKKDSTELAPSEIEKRTLEYLNKKQDYGIKFEYFEITSYAVVRTYRLIQDNMYTYEGLSMDDKR